MSKKTSVESQTKKEWTNEEIDIHVDELVKKALSALEKFESFNQEAIDYIVAKCSVAGLDQHGVLAEAAVFTESPTSTKVGDMVATVAGSDSVQPVSSRAKSRSIRHIRFMVIPSFLIFPAFILLRDAECCNKEPFRISLRFP